MATLSQVHRPKPTTATVDLGGGDTLTLVFDRDKITPAWLRDGMGVSQASGDVFAVAQALTEVLVSWDLFEDDAQTVPVPITAERLGSFSFGLLSDIISVVSTAAAPSRAEGNVSSEPSSMPPSDSTAPNGTHPGGEGVSPSLTPSASPSLT